MTLIEGCKHSIEVTVPVTDVDAETARVVEAIRQKARLPGFRPGKVPADLIRRRYQSDIRQEVLESLVPKHFRRQVEAENLQVVGTPDVTEVRFEQGEPLRFKAEFEVAPTIELKDYRNLEVSYAEPVVTDADIEKRLEEIREQKAEQINVDPRPVEDGDYAVVSLHSLSGVDGPPVEQDEVTLHVGDPDTLAAFTENLLGMSPDEEKEFDVTYPEDYSSEKLAGKTVRFRMKLKMIRRKELPEVNDEFAKDLGDYQNMEELRDAVRKSLLREREHAAQQEAKAKLIEKLVDMHDFPVPETYVDRQIEIGAEQQLRFLASQGVDVRNVKLDWQKLKESRRDKAVRDVKASLLLDRIAEREGIDATMDDVDREVQRIARQEREPAAAVRRRLEKDGTLRRIANHIRTEKTLSFLFEHARKVAPE